MIPKVIKNAFSYLKIWNHYTKTICKVIIRFKRVQKLSKFHHFRTIFELFLNLTFYPAQFYTISSKVVFFVNRKYDYYGDLWYRFINWIVIGSFRFDLYRRWWWNRIGVPSDLGEWRGDRESHSVFSIEITKQRLEKILEEKLLNCKY